MKNEKFSFVKLIRGFNLLRGANTGKLIYIIIIITACLCIFYKLFVQRTVGQQLSAQFKGATIGTLQMKQDGSNKNNAVTLFGGMVGDEQMYGGAYTRRF